MAQSEKRRATYADVEAAPEHLVAEFIDGQLVTHPRPSPRHSGTAFALGLRLGGMFQDYRSGGPGGWVFFMAPEIKFGDDLLVPDIAGWRRERLTAYPEKNYFTTAPDWVCEVWSASTVKRDRTAKRRIYAASGVAHLWLIDPRQQLLEVFELMNRQWMLAGTWRSAAAARLPPFDEISFSLADLWPLDRPLGFHEDPQPLYAGDR